MIAIGLGGNVGTFDAILERFCAARGELSRLGAMRSASVYRTAPVGPDQPVFLNSVLALDASTLSPTELHAKMQALERALGRDRAREQRWGPRTLDLDLLVWDDVVLSTPALELPHPRLASRAFALVPLAELEPELVIPGLGAIGPLLQRVADQDVVRLAAW